MDCHPNQLKKKKTQRKWVKKRRILRSCQRIQKAMEHEDDGDTNCNWCAWNGP